MSETNITTSPASPPPSLPLVLEKATRLRYHVLGVSCALAVVTYIHRVGFSRALPELGLSSEQAGWVMAVFQLAYGAFEMPCGLLGDRFGARHLLTILVLGWSLLTGCVAWVVLLPAGGAAAFAFLLVLRFLFGMFQAGAFPLLSRMMADWMPLQERASAQGTIWMASRAGGMIAPVLFGGLLALLGSWQISLWVLALLGVAWCGMFWPWFRNRPEEMPGVNAAERQRILAGRAPKSEHGAVPWRAMLRSPSVWGLCLMYGCGGFAANFYVTLLSTYLDKTRHLSPWQTSWIASLPFACGMVACVGGGLLSDGMIRRFGNRKWARRVNGLVGTACGAAGWLSLTWVESPWALGFVFCFIFFCNDLNMGPAWAACADIGERYAGTVGGAMNMIGAVLGAVGNIIAGWLFDAQQADLLFTIYAGSFLLAGLCWLLVDVTKPLTIKE